MADNVKLNHPTMVAVWPGMGNVAISAGYYLMSKLNMHLIAEYETGEFFDVDHVEVKDGVIQPGRRPWSRFYGWSDPKKKQDLVVFLGEAQPSSGRYALSHKLIDFATELGVERIFTFAAMATEMHPTHDSRVFSAATDRKGLTALRHLDVEVMEDGHIGGLNGVILGAAAEKNIPGICLLGEMPHILAQFPYPKASRAILEIFTQLTDVEVDFQELNKQVERVDQQLGELLSRAEGAVPMRTEEEGRAEPAEEERISTVDKKRIETLFREALSDRSKAYELKQELDRLGLFKDYEDRFLDLFKKAG